MPVNKPHLFDPGVYFITFTNYKWLHLFEIAKSYDLVYKWFDYLNSKGSCIVGFVIMPNHLHALIAYRTTERSINTIVGNGKRFMAYDLVDRLEKSNDAELLAILASGVSDSDRRKGKLHEVFEPSFDIKMCHGQKFINQKLSYMHANPVSKKWMLAKDAISYPHSSARLYETGVQGGYEVQHYMRLENAIMSKE